MTALTTDRNTTRAGRQAYDSPGALGVKASTIIYGGSIVVNNNGYADKGQTATSLVPLGVARKRYDNSSGSNGAINCEYDMGDFWFNNSTSGDLITTANIGSDCYIVDDNTVALTNGSSTRSRAGKVINVDAVEGVLVRFGAGL